MTKDHYFFGHIFYFIFSLNSKIMDHGLLWIKGAPMYEMHTNEEVERFLNMYISCDVSLLLNPLQNAQQHQHTCTCKKKTMFEDFIILYLPCVKQNF